MIELLKELAVWTATHLHGRSRESLTFHEVEMVKVLERLSYLKKNVDPLEITNRVRHAPQKTADANNL